MYIVIAGCGRLGANLATELSLEDHDVVVIDRDPDSFGRLGRSFAGVTVVGTAIDEGVLGEANLKRADVFVAVTDNDAANIMAAQVAKQIFGVARAIAKIDDPEREEVYRGFGIDTICPNKLGIFTAKATVLADDFLSLLPLGDGLQVFRVKARPEWVGQSMSSLAIELGGIVNAVMRGKQTILFDDSMIVMPDDQIVMTGQIESELRLKHKSLSRRN